MTFKKNILISLFLFYFLGCNKNPVELDYNNLPDKENTFPVYGIKNIIEVNSTTYYGLVTGYSNLFIITPDSIQDSTGSILRKSKSPVMFYNGRFLENTSNELFIVDENGIFKSISSDSFNTVLDFTKEKYWNNNFTFTPKNECVFIKSNSDSFSVFKWINDSDSLLFNLELPCKAYKVYDFAASDSLFGLVYSNDIIPDVYYLNIYKDGKLIENDSLFFPIEFNQIEDLFFLDGYIGILISSIVNQKYLFQLPDEQGYKYLYLNETKIIYKKPQMEWTPEYVFRSYEVNLAEGKYYKSDYKNQNEIWFHGKYGYWRIKTKYLVLNEGDHIEETIGNKTYWYSYGFEFRDSFYSTYCFKSDSSVVFYDEYYQDFISLDN